ncbi:hypothetical protein [Ekhidna sp.]
MEERHRKMDEWKSSLEHLRVQLNLGLEEAKDEFEKQKENLKDWVDAVSQKLHQAQGFTEDKAAKLKTSLEELRVQAALGRAETEEALDEQRHKMSEKIHNLKHDVNQAYQKTKGNTNELLSETKDRLDDLHTRFDLFRLQAHLAKMETDDAWEERKKDLSGKMHDINLKLEEGKEAAVEKWDHFKEEMSEAWSHFRGAFKP